MSLLRQNLTREDKYTLIRGHAFLFFLDVVAILVIVFAYKAISVAIFSLERHQEILELPRRGSIGFVGVPILLCHVTMIFTSRFSPPRPRLQRILTILVIVLGIGAVAFSFGVNTWLNSWAVTAGYQECHKSISSFTRFSQKYALSEQDCSAQPDHRE